MSYKKSDPIVRSMIELRDSLPAGESKRTLRKGIRYIEQLESTIVESHNVLGKCICSSNFCNISNKQEG